MEGSAGAPGLAAEVHNASVAAGHHRWQHCSRAAQCRPHVSVHCLLQQFLREIHQAHSNQRGRVVDEHVDAAELIDRALHHRLRLARLAEVTREGDHPASGFLGQLSRAEQCAFAGDIGDEDVGPFLCEAPRDRDTHALGRPGDDHCLTFKAAALHLHFALQGC